MAEVFLAEAVQRALDNQLKKDERVILLGSDIGLRGGLFGVTKELVLKYGEQRIIDFPASESAIDRYCSRAGGIRFPSNL